MQKNKKGIEAGGILEMQIYAIIWEENKIKKTQ